MICTYVLGPYYFTKPFLSILLSTAKSSSAGTIRVVNTASAAHWFRRLDFDFGSNSHRSKFCR
ncbi:hypothetical protein EDC04DRAFT_2569188 [Pisolithus marmoratus]|nr:hypothetical protein EDC04DRAFT_2569188 [Pisolithus marmoratus]